MKIHFLYISLIFFAFRGHSQELLPIKFEPKLSLSSKNTPLNLKNGTTLDTLELPFIDEFSTSYLTPNHLLFEDSGGTFVNNRFGVNPPTLNVVTFDGLKFDGKPYSETNQFERGKCDTLTSAPINLQNKNNVYMSFWWQAQGNAVPQVSSDSLHLMFYSENNTWEKVWAQTGQPLNDFTFEILQVDSHFLHQGFKFKFESFGNRSGMYGVWHLDYIYLDDNRSANDTLINDIAFSNTPSSFLKKYWVMPKWHFQNNPSAELNDSIITTLNNFKNDGTGLPFIIETRAQSIDNSNGNLVIIHDNPANSITAEQKQKKVVATNSSFDFINQSDKFLAIENRFKVTSNDQNIGDTVNGNVVKFSTTQNDSISSFTLLADYYAYDDGTAEQAFRINTIDGLVMQEYEISQSDTLFGMSLYFPGNPFQYDSTQIVLMVWDTIITGSSYNPNHILYDERVLIKVADSLNGFAKYNFLEPVVVNKKFYIGYRQDTDDEILIGYDINNNLNFEPIYFNTNGNWQRFQLNDGVLMIRPHFKKMVVASVGKKLSGLTNNLVIYPNPAQSTLHFNEEVNQIYIYNLNGSLVTSTQIKTDFISISSLEKGMYFIVVSTLNNGFKRSKFIKN